MMTANIGSVASALPPATAADVTMLLITTDPADDHPPQLLQNQDISGKKRILVTGPKESIERMIRLYGVKHEDTDNTMMHVMKLFLLTSDGTLVHVYLGMKVLPQTVAFDIETLLHHNFEAAAER